MTTERWLRIIAGAFILASVALGTWVNPWWFAFTAFVGLNLFQSGFTNWCPMMWVLERLGRNRSRQSAGQRTRFDAQTGENLILEDLTEWLGSDNGTHIHRGN